ncbi:MAG: dihydropteroate synthase-like protein [Candidatus Lokiarchaeota archaeon]|nr:dihydropteroate synthase-like protein [Candidatus Lokiarchaeota archaeon]MBD3200982.1 dihydropteroate synthase-like protein [Candidatus Lokiarchaeota archaeon]
MVIYIRILILTGEQSFPILKKTIEQIKKHIIDLHRVPVSISAFIKENMVKKVVENIDIDNYDLVLLPGFIQWDSANLEKKFGLKIRKGPEFASDLPWVMDNLDINQLSTKFPADKYLQKTGRNKYEEIVQKNLISAKQSIDHSNFFINENKSNIMIGRNLPPPIIAEIVNCTLKSDQKILRKVKHYLNSGADVIDIGCVSNNPKPHRVAEIIDLIQNRYDCLISIDSMNKNEILTAIEHQIDIILSLDIGNFEDFLNIPKDIPIVILPTNINKGFFPKNPEQRVENLFNLTKILMDKGFTKIIADPLLETPISPGILNSLQAYYLYYLKSSQKKYNHLKLPMFFGVSNVVELMDIDSIGINGLLASFAIELDIGILFTVEHSTKMMNGVRELKEAVKLNYLSKNNKTPPINQGIQYFKAKGKTSQDKPDIMEKNILKVEEPIETYIPDDKGYFKIYVSHYQKEICVLFYSNDNLHKKTVIGSEAEAISKKIMELNLTNNIYHINYLGRELKKAEICLDSGKPYIQDE